MDDDNPIYVRSPFSMEDTIDDQLSIMRDMKKVSEQNDQRNFEMRQKKLAVQERIAASLELIANAIMYQPEGEGSHKSQEHFKSCQ